MNLNDANKLPVNELGSVPRFGSGEEAQAYLTQRGVKYVLAQFVDIHGVAKAKSVPVAHLKGVLKAGAGFAGFAIWGVGIEPNGPDYMAVGDLSTLTPVPWQDGLARIVCDGHVDGQPWAFEPCDPSDTLAKPCYDDKGLSRTRVFLEKLTESMRSVGIDVYQIDHEDANGQFEINYTYTDCLTSCDHYVFFKMA